MSSDPTAIEIREFDAQNASAAEYVAVTELLNREQAERDPENPPRSVEQMTIRLQNIPSFLNRNFWAAWDRAGTTMVAYGLLFTFRTEENQHLGQFELVVMPEWRRQGIGTRMLRLIAAEAQRQNKSLLIIGTSASVPSGAACMTLLGAEMALEEHINQLDLHDLNGAMVDTWVAQGAARNPDYELGLWVGSYPEHEMNAIVALMRVTNDEPRGGLQVDNINWTAEQLREQETAEAARGNERWTLYVREKATDQLAGFSEVTWNPEKPGLLMQGWTAIAPQHRNRGLGRWLKAAMLVKVQRERPGVRYIRTGNADSNAPMLKINYELGFKPHIAGALWQIEVAKIQEYLAAHA